MNNLENMTILVTGATGFIGSHLVKKLMSINNTHLLLLSRQDCHAHEENVKWLKADMKDLNSAFWKRCNIPHIDVVFHLGAFTPKKKSNANNIIDIFDDNLIGTRNLLESLPSGVEKLIFASTSDVYAPVSHNEVLTEKSSLNPGGLYGASKLFCEKLVSVWADKNKCICTILRYGHIFGPGEDAFDKLIPLVIKQLSSNKPPTVYGVGMALRDYLYVAEVVEVTIRAAQAQCNIGPINIVRGESCSIREIVEILIRQTGANVDINFITDKNHGISFRFDNTAMKSELGTWPLVSIHDGLLEEVTSFEK